MVDVMKTCTFGYCFSEFNTKQCNRRQLLSLLIAHELHALIYFSHFLSNTCSLSEVTCQIHMSH